VVGVGGVEVIKLPGRQLQDFLRISLGFPYIFLTNSLGFPYISLQFLAFPCITVDFPRIS